MWDDWFGHRHPLTGEPVGDKDEWTAWDYSIAQAYQTAEYYQDSHGIFQWQKDDPLEDIAAIRKVDVYQAAVESMTKGSAKKPYQPTPGEYFIPDVKVRSGAKRPMWTYSDWLSNKLNEMRDKIDIDPPPPPISL